MESSEALPATAFPHISSQMSPWDGWAESGNEWVDVGLTAGGGFGGSWELRAEGCGANLRR